LLVGRWVGRRLSCPVSDHGVSLRKVILKGSVRSWVEKQEAERAATGVSAVENRITVML